MKRLTTFLSTNGVIALATVAFIGLTFMQVNSLRKSLDTNKQIFLQKVDLASTSIAMKFSEDIANSTSLVEAESRVLCSGALNDPDMDRRLRNLIDPELEYHGIATPYEYSVYTHKPFGDGFSFVLGDEGRGLDFQLVNCENPDERGHGWANLTCSTKIVSRDYHLALFFPEVDAYVFAQSRDALLLSVLFILLLIGCFAYTIRVIRNQKKLSEIKNEFINNLTHEFKTPISSINLSANLLKNETLKLSRERKAKYLDLIDQESQRLEGQVDKILQIAMIDSGNFTLEKEDVDIHEAISKVLDSLALAIEQKGAKVNLELDAHKSVVSGDPTHMVNIIFNLVDNALKYSAKDPEISIKTSNESQGIKIAIKDNGIGIGEEIQKFIFDKFYRVNTGDVHDVKGFGLGLSYVKNLIDAHRGSIDIVSKQNQGAEFRVYIPTT